MYTKKNPSPSNQYTDTALYQAFDNGIDEAHQRTTPSITEFTAVGDDATSNNTALQNALDSGQHLYVPPGIFRISATLQFKANGQMLTGPGTIRQMDNTLTD